MRRLLLLLLVPLALAFGCASPHPAGQAPNQAPDRAPDPALIALVETFREARESGDLERAESLLAPDPRLWWETREGDGRPLTLGPGRWAAWDEHFRSRSTNGPWRQRRTDGAIELYRVVEEWNDYFELIEREHRPRYTLTYFLEPLEDADLADPWGDMRIKGSMISAIGEDQGGPPRIDRFDEIEAWALEHHPDEWAYIRPGGRLDPTEDRAQRTRNLINRWRREVGLDPVAAN